MRIAAGQIVHFVDTRPPGVADDLSTGAWMGSLWLDGSTDPAPLWLCTAATAGAATWIEISRPEALRELVALGTGLGWGPLDLVRHHQLGAAAYLPVEAIRTGRAVDVTASITLAAADRGKRLFAISGAPVIQLPAAAGLPEDWAITVKRAGATALTIARAGADTINRAPADLSIAADTTATLARQGAANWEVI